MWIYRCSPWHTGLNFSIKGKICFVLIHEKCFKEGKNVVIVGFRLICEVYSVVICMLWSACTIYSHSGLEIKQKLKQNIISVYVHVMRDFPISC